MKPHYQALSSLSHTRFSIISKENNPNLSKEVSLKLGTGALSSPPLEKYPNAKEPLSAIDQS